MRTVASLLLRLLTAAAHARCRTAEGRPVKLILTGVPKITAPSSATASAEAARIRALIASLALLNVPGMGLRDLIRFAKRFLDDKRPTDQGYHLKADGPIITGTPV